MTDDEFKDIQKELLIKMKFMDTSIKGITESKEYKETYAYNAGIREAIDVLKKYIK